MGGIVYRLSLTIGLLLYIFDYGSDIYVAIQYWKKQEFWWFSWTVIFITASSIIVNITGIFQLKNAFSCVASVLQLSVLVRYIEAFISPDTRGLLLARLCYIETITESAPQWCLQVYIMLRQWYFPSYTVTSSVFSLLSLAWSVMTLEKARATEKHRDFKLSATLAFLTWQFFTLISRLSAIVIIAYVFRYYAIIFLVVHLLLVTGCILQISGTDDNLAVALSTSFLTAYPSLFHSSKSDVPESRSPNAEMIMRYILLLVENTVLVTLSLTIEMPDTQQMDILKPIAISCLLGGSVISIIGFIFYYCCADRDL